MRFNTSVESKHGSGDGAIEIENNEIAIFKKSQAVFYAFGAIGTALAHGKEIMRFSLDDVSSYEVTEHLFSNDLRIVLCGGDYVKIGLKSELRDYLLPLLEKAVTKNAENRSPAEKQLQESPESSCIRPLVDYSKDAESQKRVALCASCGAPLVDGATFCNKCGAKAFSDKSKMFCNRCGSPLVEGATFCNRCGASVNQDKLAQNESKSHAAERLSFSANQDLASIIIKGLDIDDPKIKRAFIFAEDGDWDKADSYFEAALDSDPTNAGVYFGKALVELKITTTEGLIDNLDALEHSQSYQRAIRFGGTEIKALLDAIVDTVYSDERNTSSPAVYHRAKKAMASAKTQADYLAAADLFKSILSFSDAEQCMGECLNEAHACFCSGIYNQALSLMAKETIDDYNAAIAQFSSISTWKDSRWKIQLCQKKIQELTLKKEEEEKAKKLALEEEEKQNKLSAQKRRTIAIVTVGLVVLFVATLVLTTAIKPNRRLSKAKALIASGDYISAYELLENWDYKDSKETLKAIKNYYYDYLFENASVGSRIFFGSYEQDGASYNGKEDIEWIVLAKEKGKILLISRNIIDVKKFDSRSKITWEKSELRSWLNKTFLSEAFTTEERNSILSTRLIMDQNSEYKTSGGNNTTDKVFILSESEVTQYFGEGISAAATPTVFAQSIQLRQFDDAKSWWLRTLGRNDTEFECVLSNGAVFEWGTSLNHMYGVRPAIWIKYSD